jgi:hypothetical protein
MWESRTLGSAELSVNEARAWAEVGCKQPAPGATQIMASIVRVAAVA